MRPIPKAIVSSMFLVAITVCVIRLSTQIPNLRSIGYLGLFIIAAISSATFVIPGPSLIGVALGGMALNPLAVGFVMGLGSAIGEIPGFLFGAINETAIKKLPGERLVRNWMSKNRNLTIFLLAAIPNFLYDFGSVLAGVSGMRIHAFLIATGLGKIIRFGSVALLASHLHGILPS